MENPKKYISLPDHLPAGVQLISNLFKSNLVSGMGSLLFSRLTPVRLLPKLNTAKGPRPSISEEWNIGMMEKWILAEWSNVLLVQFPVTGKFKK